MAYPIDSHTFSTTTSLVFGVSEDVNTHRIIGVGRKPVITYLGKADSLGADCTGSHPGGFWISPHRGRMRVRDESKCLSSKLMVLKHNASLHNNMLPMTYGEVWLYEKYLDSKNN